MAVTERLQQLQQQLDQEQQPEHQPPRLRDADLHLAKPDGTADQPSQSGQQQTAANTAAPLAEVDDDLDLEEDLQGQGYDEQMLSPADGPSATVADGDQNNNNNNKHPNKEGEEDMAAQ